MSRQPCILVGLFRKPLSSIAIERKNMLIDLCENFNIVGISTKIVIEVLKNDDWEDFEDGLQIQCAYNSDVDYIITRDPRGFEASNVQALSPDKFLKLV